MFLIYLKQDFVNKMTIKTIKNKMENLKMQKVQGLVKGKAWTMLARKQNLKNKFWE